MGNLILTSQYGQNITSEEATATLNDVVKGKTALTSDSKDGLASGTLELTGTASPARVVAGSTFYSIDPHNKETGVMANVAAIDPSKSVTLSGGVVYARMTNGAHLQNASSGYPEVSIQQPALASAIGLTGAKLGVGHNVLGIAGTYGNDATATAPYIAKGYTAYGKTGKITGTMTVSSVVSFSAAAYSTSQVICTWKNPAKGPYSGVIIRYKTGSYPTGVSDGSGYQGIGSNSSLNAASSFTVGGLAAGTIYYFRIWMYCNTSAGTLYSSSYLQATCKTTASGRTVFTASGTFTVPANVRSLKVCVVGAGGSTYRKGSSNSKRTTCGGGSGGYVENQTISVTPGQQFAVAVGAPLKISVTGTGSVTHSYQYKTKSGGTRPSNVNDFTIWKSSSVKAFRSGSSSFGSIAANGGLGYRGFFDGGLPGGSGAGACAGATNINGSVGAGAPGNNGGNGGDAIGKSEGYDMSDSGTWYYGFGGTGQGKSTKEHGNGTLYATAGKSAMYGAKCQDGTPNTGNGASGGGFISNSSESAVGGSGVVVVSW